MLATNRWYPFEQFGGLTKKRLPQNENKNGWGKPMFEAGLCTIPKKLRNLLAANGRGTNGRSICI